MEPVRYIIVGPQRSGTTFIHSGLREHPRISALNGEVSIEKFFERNLNIFVNGNEGSFTGKESENKHLKLFDLLSNLEDKTNPLAVGLKCAVSSYAQIDILLEKIREHYPLVRLIIINRTNVLDQFVSLERAKQYGYWHSTHQGQPSENLILNLKEKAFINFFYNHKKVLEGLDHLANSFQTLKLNYEHDILQNGNFIFKDIFTYLEVPIINPTWVKMEKLNSVREDQLTNLPKIKNLYKELEGMDLEEIPKKFKSSFRKNRFFDLLKRKVFK